MKQIGIIAVTILVTALASYFLFRKEAKTITVTETVEKTVYKDTCATIIDSMAVYTEVRKGILSSYKVTPKVVSVNKSKEDSVTISPCVLDTSLYVATLDTTALFIAEEILVAGEILDFKRTIRQDTLLLREMYKVTETKFIPEVVTKEIPKLIPTVVKEGIWYGGADVEYDGNFDYNAKVARKFKNDWMIGVDKSVMFPTKISFNLLVPLKRNQ